MVIDAAQEKKEIINRYRRLLRKAKPVLREGDAKQIKKAFTMALEAHKDMRRKSGEPYIFHPLAVAQICVEEIGLGTTSIMLRCCTMWWKTPTLNWMKSRGCSVRKWREL